MSISIIIPVRNEEKSLPKCINSIKIASSYIDNEVEIIAVINRCTDNSEEVAKNLNCKIVHCLEKNLSKIRNEGIKNATSDIIITVDADSIISKKLLLKVVTSLNTNKYIGGGVSILPERWSLGILCTLLTLIPFFLFWRISAGLFFTKKEYIKAIGGFNENMYSAEDIDFAKRLKKFGQTRNLKYKNLFSAYIITSCRKFDKFGDWYALKNPKLMLKLLKGKKSKEADKIWYDF